MKKYLTNIFGMSLNGLLVVFFCLPMRVEAESVLELKNGLVSVPDNLGYKIPSLAWEYLPSGEERMFYEPPKAMPSYEIAWDINPFYIRVDLDGNGDPEYLILIRNRVSKKLGFIVCGFGKHCEAYFAGVNTPIISLDPESGAIKSSTTMDDLSWSNWWREYDHKQGVEIINEYRPYLKEAMQLETPAGEVVSIKKLESGGVYIYWNGRQIVVFAPPS